MTLFLHGFLAGVLFLLLSSSSEPRFRRRLLAAGLVALTVGSLIPLYSLTQRPAEIDWIVAYAWALRCFGGGTALGVVVRNALDRQRAGSAGRRFDSLLEP
jgi:hypothetical protein